MAEEPDSIVLQYLRKIDVKLDRLNRILAHEESASPRLSGVSRVERSARARRFQLIRDMTPYNVVQTDSVSLLREDRDR